MPWRRGTQSRVLAMVPGAGVEYDSALSTRLGVRGAARRAGVRVLRGRALARSHADAAGFNRRIRPVADLRSAVRLERRAAAVVPSQRLWVPVPGQHSARGALPPQCAVPLRVLCPSHRPIRCAAHVASGRVHVRAGPLAGVLVPGRPGGRHCLRVRRVVRDAVGVRLVLWGHHVATSGCADGLRYSPFAACGLGLGLGLRRGRAGPGGAPGQRRDDGAAFGTGHRGLRVVALA